MPRIAYITNIILLALLALCIAACTPTAEDEYGHIGRKVSISHLKSLAVSKSQAIRSDVVIVGRVVANDKLGELNRAIAIMDDTAAIELKIDCSDIDIIIPLYSEVVVRCTGLWIGCEGEKIVLGAEPTSHYVVDRVAEKELFTIIKEVNLPDTMPTSRRRTISDIEQLDMSALVRIDNLRFIDVGARWCDKDTTSGRYIETLRYAEDATGIIGVLTDGDCDYRMEMLPDGEVAIYAIVDSYLSERVLRITNHGIIP